MQRYRLGACLIVASGLFYGCAADMTSKAAQAVKYTPVGAQMTVAREGLKLAESAGKEATKQTTTQPAQAAPSSANSAAQPASVP